MSYPPPSSYTPPYGQPHMPPPQRNLWLIGASVIAVVIILMTVTLLIVMQTSDQDRADGNGPGTGGETTPEATSEAENDDDDDGAAPTPSEDETSDSGSGGNSSSGTAFTEETCDEYDLSEFEEVFGTEVDPETSNTSAWEGHAADTGSVTCWFYMGWDSATISTNVHKDAATAKSRHESDREYWDGEAKYDLADYKEFGDEGYYYTFGSSSAKKVLIHVVVGNITIEADTWLDLSEHDLEDVLAMLQRLIDQAYELFDEYETS